MERSLGISGKDILFSAKKRAYRFASPFFLAAALSSCGVPPPPGYAGQAPGIEAIGGTPIPISGVAEPAPAGNPPSAPASGGEGPRPSEADSTAWVTIRPDGYIWFNLEAYQNGSCAPPGDIPQELAQAIIKHFGTGQIAAEAAVVAWSENGKFDPNATPTNSGGSQDYSYFQLNSDNLPIFQQNMPGVHTMEDLRGADMNAAGAKLLFDRAGQTWGPWYGPGNKGCNV